MFINVCFERRVFTRIPQDGDHEDASKGIECPKFSGKEEDYHVWVTKFDAYSMVKGFYKIMDGTEVPVPYAQANKTTEELKLEEKQDVGYCTLLLAMDSTGKHSARSLMQSQRTSRKCA